MIRGIKIAGIPVRDQDAALTFYTEKLGFKVATDNHHTFANGLRWGPDGWLYGRCGASSPGQVGVPGTPDVERIPIRGGICAICGCLLLQVFRKCEILFLTWYRRLHC